MRIDLSEIEAVTLDFYNTLAYHKQGSGRGVMLMEYLRSQGFESDPWEHQVLYDVFERHATDYSPDFDEEEKHEYLVWFAERLFRRLNVRVDEGASAEHVEGVWRVLGPGSLGVYADVQPALRALRAAGYPLAIISNWQRGLENFCRELGIADLVDYIVASAEVGMAKPEPRIFLDVCVKVGVSSERVIHVGDSVVDDVGGGRSAGMKVILIQREGEPEAPNTPTIDSLSRLPELLTSST